MSNLELTGNELELNCEHFCWASYVKELQEKKDASGQELGYSSFVSNDNIYKKNQVWKSYFVHWKFAPKN